MNRSQKYDLRDLDSYKFFFFFFGLDDDEIRVIENDYLNY